VDDNTSSDPGQVQSAFSTPLAIVVAGALVAGAIYFGNGGVGRTPAATDSDGVPAGTVAAAAQPAAQGNPAGAGAPSAVTVRPVAADDHVRGSSDAKVTVIEYSDFECPFCKRFHPTMAQLLDEFPDDVRWVYRHFPLEQIHPNARIAALATECAGEQGKFWELTDYIFENTSTGAEIAVSELPALAGAAGVPNANQFQTCLSSGKYEDAIDADMADAQQAGARGTPYSVILGPNGETEPLSGALPYASVKTVVEKYL